MDEITQDQNRCLSDILSQNDHSSAFFDSLLNAIEQLKRDGDQNSLSLLGSRIADNKKCRMSFFTLDDGEKGLGTFSPPKKCVSQNGRKIQIKGLEQILFKRLKDLGAKAHIKTISRCSECGLRLYRESEGGNLVASYNLPCRKPLCPYCSHLAKRGSDVLDRSQAIVERGKKHLRYCQVGGEVKFYGRIIFTLPKIIQQQVDRKDLKNWEEYGDVRVYGDKISREIADAKDEKENMLAGIDNDKEREKTRDMFDSKIHRKVKRVLMIEELEKRLCQVKGEIKLAYDSNLRGTVTLERLKDEKKRLSAFIKRQKTAFERGRISFNDIQKAVWHFMKEVLGVDGALLTPHLTGEGSAKRGELHIHFHTLFPLFGDESGFDWGKGEPFIADLAALNAKWKSFLETRFGVTIDGNLANPEYSYVRSDGKELADMQKLAFDVRYDHRVEAGGALFPILASDKDARKVLRMTTRQRYTRGYGCLSDRNLKWFQYGIPLKDKLAELGDKEAKDIEGEWKVLREGDLTKDLPFVGYIQKDGKEIANLDNLPVEGVTEEEETGDPVFVWYAGEEPETGESAFEICFFHQEFGVYGFWKKRRKGEQKGGILRRLPGDTQKDVDFEKEGIEFVLSRVVGKLPEDAEEATNGFFMWQRELTEEQIREREDKEEEQKEREAIMTEHLL